MVDIYRKANCRNIHNNWKVFILVQKNLFTNGDDGMFCLTPMCQDKVNAGCQEFEGELLE